MIKIENVEVVGWGHAIRGMRNPKNSWDKSDSFQCDGIGCYFEDCPQYIRPIEWRSEGGCSTEGEYVIGKNDLALMKKLAKAGTDHRKFMRMITVYLDITAPLYWWKEFDTYKVGTVANSCSTMHKIHAKEFTLDDFSIEHLISKKINFGLKKVSEFGWENTDPEGVDVDGNYMYPDYLVEITIDYLNHYRNLYLETKDKKYWWQMIQLLPSSYNQKRTVMLNYEVLANMYKSRKAHKLDEWRTLCEWIKQLPYSELIIGREETNE